MVVADLELHGLAFRENRGPCGALRTLIGAACCVVVWDDLDRAVHIAEASDPLELVAGEVVHAFSCVGVRPRYGAGAGERHAAAVDLDAFLVLVGVILAGVRVAVRLCAVLQTDQSERSPLGSCEKVPALSLGLAEAAGLVKVQTAGRLLEGQRVRQALDHGRGVFADAEL